MASPSPSKIEAKWRTSVAYQFCAARPDRRTNQRYAMALEVSYRVVRRGRNTLEGTGCTVDLSTGGILLDAGQSVPENCQIELSVAWPARLHDKVALNLWVVGTVVRCSGTQVAVRISRHGFRTRGKLTELAPALNPPSGRLSA